MKKAIGKGKAASKGPAKAKPVTTKELVEAITLAAAKKPAKKKKRRFPESFDPGTGGGGVVVKVVRRFPKDFDIGHGNGGVIPAKKPPKGKK